MKIVAFLTLVHILVISSGVEGRHHSFRGVGNGDRDLKSKSKKGSGSGSNAEAGNRVPLCMTKTPPDCKTWALDEAEINRATGPGIPGYTLSNTVIDPDTKAIYNVYLPDVPTDGGGEVDGGG